MSIATVLATLTVCTVLLGNVTATVFITAPSKVIDKTGDLETREQGPTAWICSALVVDSPWTAYANIQGYLDGGNAQGKNYIDLVLYPVMELFHVTQDQSRLCVYLPDIDHCYPPAPITDAVMVVKQLTKRNYFAIQFWGQASNARVKYYRDKLAMALTTYNKAAKLDLFFLSFFSDHIREVRFDSAVTPEVSPVPTLPEKKISLSQCPTVYQTGMEQPGNDLYVIGQVSWARLEMFDVQKTVDTTIITRSACMALATSKGVDAFHHSPVDDCYMYNFGKDYCPCKGELSLEVNRKRLEKNEFSYKTHHSNEDLDEIVYFSEIVVSSFMPSLHFESPDTATENCEKVLLAQPVDTPSMSAVFDYGGCYVSLIHDVANCNQTCRGEPQRALVRKKTPNAIVHFLSNCGKTLQVTAKSKQESSIYLSHPGTGCYYYPTPNSPEEEDCLITFEKAPTANTLDVVWDFIFLDVYEGVCQDKLEFYSGPTADYASLVETKCTEGDTKGVTIMEAVTINFRRSNSTGTEKLGFRLSIFNV